jgi:hypothetical protein
MLRELLETLKIYRDRFATVSNTQPEFADKTCSYRRLPGLQFNRV